MAGETRKLTTILVADVAGYSRLMGADESGTLARLKSHRLVVAEQVAISHGRVVNTAGDGVLAEFASVVEAVNCALQIQRIVAERNAGLPADRQMQFRIGINLGDVMVDGNDLFGDGVNVAARLEGLAEPGGILVSGAVFDQVKDKLSVAFDYLGPQWVKNITAAVPAYRVLSGSDHVASHAHASAEVPHPPQAGRLRRLIASGANMLALIGLLFAINMLSNSSKLWFQWPALGIVFIFVVRALRSLSPRDVEPWRRHLGRRQR